MTYASCDTAKYKMKNWQYGQLNWVPQNPWTITYTRRPN